MSRHIGVSGDGALGFQGLGLSVCGFWKCKDQIFRV